MNEKSRQTYIEIGGVIGIVVSLVLLAYEIRQNTLAVQASALQQHFEQHTTLVYAALENSELRDAVAKGRDGLESLDDAEINLFVPYNWNIIRSNFVAFELMRSGMLPEAQWVTFEAALARRLRRSQGVRDLWSVRGTEFSGEFQLLVNDILNSDEEIPVF